VFWQVAPPFWVQPDVAYSGKPITPEIVVDVPSVQSVHAVPASEPLAPVPVHTVEPSSLPPRSLIDSG
jgi:hypothetical protein